jgi:hypothetical protein
MTLPAWMNINNDYPGVDNAPDTSFPQPIPPPDVDPQTGDLFTVAFNPLWTPALLAACDQLINPATWQGTDDERLLAMNRAILLKNLIADGVEQEVGTPYWDDDEDVDSEAPIDEQTWYGTVSNPDAPPAELDFVENALVWTFTGLIALATPELAFAPAILFHTIAPKFLIATKRGDVGELIRILVDGSEAARVDTSGYAPGEIINTQIIADPSLDTHTLTIVQVS